MMGSSQSNTIRDTDVLRESDVKHDEVWSVMVDGDSHYDYKLAYGPHKIENIPDERSTKSSGNDAEAELKNQHANKFENQHANKIENQQLQQTVTSDIQNINTDIPCSAQEQPTKLSNSQTENEQKDEERSTESVQHIQLPSSGNHAEAELYADKSEDHQLQQKVRRHFQNNSTENEQKDTPTVIASSAAAECFNLPGVEVLDHISVTVTQPAKTFDWKKYGLKLHIPADSLGNGFQQCQLDIIVSIAGQYKLPENFSPFSAIFWVRTTPPHKNIFKKQLTMEMQHCAKITTSTNISFLRADCSRGYPYQFKAVKNPGSFSKSSSYGVLQIEHFSGFAIVSDNADELYFASLYNKQINIRKIEIYFVITKDTKAHFEAVKQHFDQINAERMATLDIEFELRRFKEPYVRLDIPMEGVAIGKWKITPITDPLIKKLRVDSFKPSDSGASSDYRINTLSRKMVADLPQNCSIPNTPDYHTVTLVGARGTHTRENQMNIQLDVLARSEGTVYPSHIHGVLTLGELVAKVDINQEDLNLECSENHLVIEISKVIYNWLQFAKPLGLSPQEINDIETDRNLTTGQMKVLKMLEIWHQPRGVHATCLCLVTTSLGLRDATTAEQICRIVKGILNTHTSDELA